MARTSTYDGPAAALALFEKLVATNPTVDRKGAKTPYTSRNGHMFSFLDAAGSMGLRLSPEAREEFLDKYETTLVEQHGHLMKDYVVVPDKLLENTRELSTWFDRSHDYIGTLKPKPIKRP